MAWVGVGFDGVLADSRSGEPIRPMVERVRGMMAAGDQVRILTGRVAPMFLRGGSMASAAAASMTADMIGTWCEQHLGKRLPVTALIDEDMAMMFDYRCSPLVVESAGLTQ